MFIYKTGGVRLPKTPGRAPGEGVSEGQAGPALRQEPIACGCGCVGVAGAWPPHQSQHQDRVSRRFMYSCSAFRRASISAMSAAWWSELYSGVTGKGFQGFSSSGAAGAGKTWRPRLTFGGEPAPRTGQASLRAAPLHGRGLLLQGKGKTGGRAPLPPASKPRKKRRA